MMYLLSDSRMSDREKECATAWLKAAIDDNDPDTAAYWQQEGLKARLARVAPGEEMQEPPAPEYKPHKAKPVCPDCGSATCKNSVCLL